jgi:predicted ArsR family transcriptional regulator
MESESRTRILFFLKTKGAQTAGQLARWLRLTTMGVRQHLAILRESGQVEFEDQRVGVGRPSRLWRLTAAGHQAFPEGYADLAVDLLQAVRRTFGNQGLEALVEERTQRQIENYRHDINADSLEDRVAALTRIRRTEGYMAEWSRAADGSYLLVENHCPICAAAEICQGLCGGEQTLFEEVLGSQVEVQRTEHLLQGDRRCAYRICTADDRGVARS